MNIWNDYTKIPLPQLLSYVVDNRGKTVPLAEDGTHILIATNCVRNDSLYPSYDKVRFLSDETYKNWFRSHPLPGDILFVCKGTPGRVCMVPDPIDFCIAQDMVALRVDEKRIYNRYLLAILRSREIQLQITNTSVGDTIPHFKKQFFDQLLIPIPPMDVQKEIGDMYFAFALKIELNKKINQNLEEQLSILFANSFADSILTASTDTCPMLGDMVTIIDNRGKTPPLTTDTYEYPIIDVGALKGAGRIIDYKNCTKYVERTTYETWFRSGHPKPWDVLLSTVGSLAEMKIYLGTKGCMAQNVVALRPKTISPLYLYQYLRYIRNDLVAYNIGSVQPSIKVTHIIKHPIFIPDELSLRSFESTAKAVTDQLYANYSENELLSELRDTLLPRLMSGELDVSKIEI